MKILIVDDEKMIRNWLTMLLDQISDKDLEIASASNVDDALAYCQEHEVHLVITDITMPQRTGLELLQILRQTKPKICTAVLSAYDDFQYIRSAMQLGAIDYILKGDMQLSDLRSVIRKVELFSDDLVSAPVSRGTLATGRDYDLADFLDDADSLEAFLAEVNQQFRPQDFVVYIFSPEDARGLRPARMLEVCNRTLASEMLTGSTFQLQGAFWVVYNARDAIPEHQRETQQRFALLLERNVVTLLHRTIRTEAQFTAADVPQLREELQTQLALLRCRQYYADAAGETQFPHLDRDVLLQVVKKVRFLLDTRRYSEAADFLEETVEQFHRGRTDPEDLKVAICHCIAIIFLNTTELKNDFVFASHYQNINRQLNIANTEASVSDLVHKVCSLYKDELKGTKKTLANPSLNRVIEYIDQNYMHRLTLEDVAQRVFLNKTYISQMFMRYLGISFVSYLESVRIYKAQELLLDTEMSVTKISEEVGYASQSYFTKAFKKRVGMSPLQYRSLSAGDGAAP